MREGQCSSVAGGRARVIAWGGGGVSQQGSGVNSRKIRIHGLFNSAAQFGSESQSRSSFRRFLPDIGRRGWEVAETKREKKTGQGREDYFVVFVRLKSFLFAQVVKCLRDVGYWRGGEGYRRGCFLEVIFGVEVVFRCLKQP